MHQEEWKLIYKTYYKPLYLYALSLCKNQQDAEDILANLIGQEERRRLFYEIQNLPLKMKEILMESVYFHLKDEEIAKLHGISHENVRKIRSRAKQKLIERMKED